MENCQAFEVSGGDIFVDIGYKPDTAQGRATSLPTELLPRQRQVTAEPSSGR